MKVLILLLIGFLSISAEVDYEYIGKEVVIGTDTLVIIQIYENEYKHDIIRFDNDVIMDKNIVDQLIRKSDDKIK